MRPLLALVLLVGCVSSVPVPGERELAVARREHPEATLASLGHGRDRYVAKCAGCHSLPAPREKTADEWPHVLDTMFPKAKCATEDRRAIEQYLLAVTRVE